MPAYPLLWYIAWSILLNASYHAFLPYLLGTLLCTLAAFLSGGGLLLTARRMRQWR